MTPLQALPLTARNKTMGEQSNDAQPGGGCALCFGPRCQRSTEDKFTVCKRVFFYIYNFAVNCSHEHGGWCNASFLIAKIDRLLGSGKGDSRVLGGG